MVFRDANASEGIGKGFLGKIPSVGKALCWTVYPIGKIKSRFDAKHVLYHQLTQGCLVEFYISSP